jgi:hypothetical protein
MLVTDYLFFCVWRMLVVIQVSVERRKRRDKGTRLMTPRDRWVLRWIADQYAVRIDHVRQLLSRDPCTRNPAKVPGPGGVTLSNVLRVVGRWSREPEWAEYRRIYADTPGWVVATPYGMQLVSLPYSRHTLKESTLEHLHWINCVRLDVEKRHPEYQWISERRIRSESRQFPGRDEEIGSIGHIPDARIWTGQRSIAVEVELSPKREQELDDIFQALLFGNEAQPAHQTVWYFVGSATSVNTQAQRAVEGARLRLPDEQRNRIQIIELERVL